MTDCCCCLLRQTPEDSGRAGKKGQGLDEEEAKTIERGKRWAKDGWGSGAWRPASGGIPRLPLVANGIRGPASGFTLRLPGGAWGGEGGEEGDHPLGWRPEVVYSLVGRVGGAAEKVPGGVCGPGAVRAVFGLGQADPLTV